MTQSKDFNHIKQWLIPKLDEKGVSVEQFATATGLSRASIYNYLEDRYRPDEQSMVRICRVLGVPLEEGFRQYSPRRRGRPKGFSPSLAQVSTRS